MKPGTSLLIINDSEQILLLLRDDTPAIPCPGMWDLPGGGVEPGETPDDCIVREIEEELGLQIEVPNRFRITEFPDRTEYTYWMHRNLDIAEIKLGEGQDLRWFSRADAAETELAFQLGVVVEEFFRKRPWTPRTVCPLKIPLDWTDGFPDPRRDCRRRHPIIGWLVAPFLKSRFAILEEQVEAELRGRTLSLEEAWVDHPTHLPVVSRLQDFFEEHLWFFPPVFLPEDSYTVLGQWLTGDLCEIQALRAIEREYKLSIPDDFVASDPTMLDVVRFIEENRSDGNQRD